MSMLISVPVAFLFGIGMQALRLKVRASWIVAFSGVVGFLFPVVAVPNPEGPLLNAASCFVGVVLGYFLLRNRITPMRDHRQELIDEIHSRVRDGNVVVVDKEGNPIPANDVLKETPK